MVTSDDVFDAVRRGYTEYSDASASEIIDYFSSLNHNEFIGHLSNIKGIVFEQEVVDALNEQGLDAAVFEMTNHPATDIALFDEEDTIAEIQLKATDSVSYISSTLENHPDIPIISTSEVANHFEETSMVIDSGLSNEVLTQSVSSVLLDSEHIDAATEIGNEIASDCVSDSLADTLTDSVLPIPVSPLGAIASLIGLLL